MVVSKTPESRRTGPLGQAHCWLRQLCRKCVGGATACHAVRQHHQGCRAGWEGVDRISDATCVRRGAVELGGKNGAQSDFQQAQVRSVRFQLVMPRNIFSFSVYVPIFVVFKNLRAWLECSSYYVPL